MKIATITIFCNEHFRLASWKEYYEEYKEDVALHIIVNNGKAEDTEYLQKEFPSSLVLYSPTNNLLAAYNLGLREILEHHPEIDAIAQLTNDIKLSPHGFVYLYNFLYSHIDYGMVSPVLLEKDCTTVCQYGSTISMKNFSFNHNYSKCDLNELPMREMECSGLPAGICLAKRKVYEKVGYQDEQIFMYGDETDIDYRIAKAGYKLAVTTDVLSWHQHVNYPGKKMRNPMAAFFMGRNHIYIARKHFGGWRAFCCAMHYLKKVTGYTLACVYHNKSHEEYIYNWYMLRGIWKGLIGDFSNNIK